MTPRSKYAPGRPRQTDEVRSHVVAFRLTRREAAALREARIDPATYMRAIAREIIRDYDIDNVPKSGAAFCTRKGLVYFMFAPTTRRIKIGFTSSEASKRLRALQVGCPERLRIIGTMRGSTAFEESLHRRFDHARSHGEWFNITDDLLKFISEGCADYDEIALRRAA